jgi:hypothetical protein
MALTKPYVIVSKGLKPIKDGLAARTIDDMIERIAESDPDSVGADCNQPTTPWDGGKDALPPMGKGTEQSDD